MNTLDQYNPVKQFVDNGPTQNEQMGTDQTSSMPLTSQNELVNVRDPDTLEIGSIPSSELAQAKEQGFQPITKDEARQYVHEQKYGSTGQQALTALEGAGVGATFGLSTLAERALGVDPEDIRARAETNPGLHGLGEGAGVAASALIPVYGEANVLEHAGASAAAHLIPAGREAFGAAKALAAAREAGVGVQEAEAAYKAAKAAQPFLVKVGTNAANQAVQGALIGAGDEVSKMFASDPHQTLGTAITDIGLSSLLGGGIGASFGAASPAWEKLAGGRTESFLNKLKNRINGETVPIGQDLETVLKDAPPEIKAVFMNDPRMQTHYQTLMESGTSSGDALRQTVDDFRNNVIDNMTKSVAPTENLTAHEAGEKAKASLLETTERLHNDVRSKYNDIGDVSQVQIPDEARLKSYDSLTEKGQNFGSKGSPSEALFKNYSERLLAQDTIGDLDKLATEIGSDKNAAWRSGDFEKSRAYGEILDHIRNFQDTELDRQAMELAKATGDENIILSAKLAQDQRSQARAAYKEFMGKLGEISSVGKLGKVKSFGQFQEALEKVPSAKLAERLFDKKNIEALNYLKENHPDIFQILLDQRKTSLIESASKSGELSTAKLSNSINSLPKEVKELMFTPEQIQNIEYSNEVLRKLGERINPSGTSRGLDTLWNKMPMGVGAAAGLLTGHNPLVGGLVGEAATALGRKIPDAIRLALLKFMGGSGPVDSGAFKALVDYAEKAYRGQKLVANAAKSIFVPSAEVTSKSFVPTQTERDKLDERLKEIQKNPDKMFEMGGKVAYYSPDHATALSQTIANSVNFLNSQRPQPIKKAPLDPEMPVSFSQKVQYERTLNIAQQPLFVMKHIKEGSILPSDVNTLKTLYPGLYQNISQQLTNNMIEAVHDEKSISYKTKQGLSIFLGSPVDSIFTPQSIQAAQGTFAQQKANQAATTQSGPQRVSKNTGKMGKIAQSFKTSSQASQERQMSDY